MAPTVSNENTLPRSVLAGAKLAHPEPGEEVVISGLSGRFPDSDDVYEFRDKLFNKVDLVSDDGRRWKLDHPEIPQRTGKINLVSKFDASFFGVHYKQAHTMDPMCRMLLERAYEAIVDAGFNPRHLKGSRCGVFIGACFSESEKTWFYEKIQVNGFGITGCSRAMLANRISYWLGVNGPSYTVDSACSSSLYALEHAYKAIRDGHCDMALVGGANLCLHPYVSLQFSRLGVLSADGSCKSFDNSANGYCRSEAIPMIFLQKAKDARRVYATVVHAKTNCDGYKEQGITYPSGHMQYELLREFYVECGIDPTTLNFVEAHGTGTKVGDPEECNALDKIFCAGKNEPLWIGSVKSNIGHSEPASGLCSVTKVIIAMESGYIPPNLHFKTPREGIPAFVEGRMKVVTEKQPWPGGLAGINSFGFGGANCHVLLRWNEKEKINGGAPRDNIPRLVVVSGRTEEACKVLLDDLESRPIDVEFVKLLHEVHSEEIPGHIYRGFTVLTNTERKIRDIQYFPGEKRKIWFIFSGMGSQWPGMGRSLLKIPVFSAAIEKCHSVLAQKGVDLMRILTEEDPKIFDNILNSFVGIAAIQIGLVDVLHSIGIYPDNIIGHSVGELGCAYADGCFTAEQMILAAYYRGLASIETDFIRGSMAAVGMGYQKIKDSLPPEIEVACHNGPDSCTLSGPADSMKKFVSELTTQGIFAREVPCSNIPYHSKYIAKAGPKLLQYLQKVIPHPKLRSPKWICTSLPQNKWNTALAKSSSAEYHTNNLLSAVLFEEACVHIPNNAITIEIAPHGLLQAILRRSLKKDTTNVALTQRGHADNSQVLLTGIGKLYEVGLQVQLANLYPPVQYPVSRGTPMISPLVKWEHSEDWYVTSYRLQEKIKSGERTISISLNDEDMEFMAGHIIDGRNLFPATGYLSLVWETIGMMRGELYTQLSIVFENVKFNRATTIPKEGSIDFTIMVQKGSGNFEVVEGGAAIVTGRAYVPENMNKVMAKLPPLTPAEGKDLLPLTARDIYKELRLRGYHYSGMFRGLQTIDNLGTVGKITWANNYVAFMDNMLQTQIIQEDTRGLYVPTSIQKLVIDAKKHVQCVHALDPEGDRGLPVYVYKEVKIISSGGIQIRDLKASQIPRRKPLGDPVLERYSFVPHITPEKSQSPSLLETIRLCLHLALENVQGIKVKVVEIGDVTVNPESTLVAPLVTSVLGDLPLIQAEVTVLSPPNNPKATDLGPGITVEDKKLAAEQNCLAVVGSNLLGRTEILQQSLGSLKQDGFLIARESVDATLNLEGFHVLVDKVVDNERILLVRKIGKTSNFSVVPTVMKISEKDSFTWISTLKEYIKDPTIQSIILVAENEKINGLIGLVNCLRKEPGGEIVRCVFIMDEKAPPFNVTDPFYAQQLAKDLAVNVLKDGKWGSYRHEALPPLPPVEVRQAFLNTSVRGDLSSFKCYEGPLNANTHWLTPENDITVYYSSINFRDVMIASGKLSTDVIARGRLEQEIVIGFEFSGRITSTGRRIMGMITKGAMTSCIALNNYDCLIWDVPDDWTLEEAATVPVVYGTVYTSLLTNGRMKRGESILIHSGSGGVGLAAIHIALYYGCEVFTTVGTPEKREYIKQLFPQIKDSHIGNSRDTSFEQMIKLETKGRGVDLVLNSLAEEKLQASVRCLAKEGRFLEIGKYDLANNNPLGLEMFLDNKSFHGVQLDAIFHASLTRKMEFNQMLKDALLTGAIKPLKTTVFDVTEVEQAFRYMAAGKHMGKVLLKMRDEEPERRALPSPKLFLSEPRFFCSDQKSYIVIGGLGGFGLELTDWLAIRGARKIVLTSRTGLRTGYQALRIRLWRSYGAEVFISTQDVTTEQGIINLMNEAKALGPIDGIFNLAVVLRDAIFENQTEEDFNISFGPKAVATKLLDKVSRKMCPELSHFVIFSSVSCGRGNAGQTNYGMANSVMERICEARVQDGLPGLAIQWGAIGEVGLVAEMQEEHQELVIGGTLQQTVSSCLECLDVFLKQKHPVVASMVVAEKRAGGSGGGNIVDTVVNIMGIRDLKTVSLHSSLAELGMDSMMAVEIKQTLEREFEVYLTAQDIRGLTFAKLAELGAKAEETSSAGVDKLTPTNQVGETNFQGLNLILRLVGEEMLASEPLVAMESQVGDAAANMITPTAENPPVFLIPGVEGMASVFENLAKKLEYPTICLQFPYNDLANENMQKIANTMLPNLKAHLPHGVPFTIVGYSTGAIVALELAFLLEAEGRMGRLFLLDGSPDFLITLCKAAVGGESEEEFDTLLLLHMYSTFVPGNTAPIREELDKLKTWDEKLEKLMSIVPDTVPHSKRHQIIMAKDLRSRLQAILRYERNYFMKLMMKVTLIRPVEQVFPNIFPEDYNLSKFCDQPVEVHFVDGNHLTMLDSKKISLIINRKFAQEADAKSFKTSIMSTEGHTPISEIQKTK